MTLLNNLIEDLVAKVMKHENYLTYKIADEGENSAKGDGYLGEISFITVNAAKNGVRKPYHMVIKTAKTSDDFRMKTPIREVFEREVYMYNTIFPAYKSFFNEYCVEFPKVNFPHIYASCLDNKRESIVLQNLKTIGYDLHNRLMPMNLNHAHMVFAKYGQFHGISLALRHKQSSVFRNLTKDMTDLFGIFLTQANMIPSLQTDFKYAMDLLRKLGRLDLVRKYEKCRFYEEMDKIATKSTDPSDPASVILHGDCWNNNFMFKYEGLTKEQPTDMVFIDFQLSRVASPIYDLSYFFYACCDRHIQSDLMFLLEVYHNNVTSILKSFGCNVNDILPFEKLIDHWKTFGKYGLIMSLFIVRIELSHPNEAPDLADIADKGNMDECLSFKIANQVQYDQRISDNYIQFAEQFL